MSGAGHVEFEHKYVVDDAEAAALEAAEALSTGRLPEAGGPSYALDVRGTDVYYAGPPGVVLRYRSEWRLSKTGWGALLDRPDETRELTVKSSGGDAESRLEVNIKLEVGRDHRADADAAAGALGFRLAAVVEKRAKVWGLGDCEVCSYEAVGPGGLRVRCVEFEALDFEDEGEARAAVERWEAALGFSGRRRERRSLLELMTAGAAAPGDGIIPPGGGT